VRKGHLRDLLVQRVPQPPLQSLQVRQEGPLGAVAPRKPRKSREYQALQRARSARQMWSEPGPTNRLRAVRGTTMTLKRILCRIMRTFSFSRTRQEMRSLQVVAHLLPSESIRVLTLCGWKSLIGLKMSNIRPEVKYETTTINEQTLNLRIYTVHKAST